MIDDRINVPEATAFIARKLEKFDTSRLDWFKLLPLCKRTWHGRCEYPKRLHKGSQEFVHGYRVGCSANPNARFPRTEEISVGTWTITQDHGTAWGYNSEPVTFRSLNELVVWIAGHESSHFLHHSRQILGRNSEPSANRFAIDWLKEFRG